MAERRMLPRVFGRVHPRFGTPSGSILIAAAVHAVLVTASFEALLVIDVLLFVMSYLLIFAASVALRSREPELERPFRVPLGTVGLAVFAAVPATVALVVLMANGVQALVVGTLAAATGPVAYALLRRREGASEHGTGGR
jgi:amino acid transporter